MSGENVTEVQNAADVGSVTDVLANTFTGAVDNLITSAQTVFPGLVAAIVVFIIGWIAAVLVSRLVGGFLKAIKLEGFLKDHKVEDALGSVRISDVLVKIVKYYIILIFLQAAATYVTLDTLSFLLGEVLLYAPLFIAAVILMLVAVILGEYAKESILELKSKSPMVQLVARGAKLIVIYVGFTMAMGTIDISTTLLDGIFLVILGAIALGLALAIGISFGLGGQKDAQEIIGKGRKMLKF